MKYFTTTLVVMAFFAAAAVFHINTYDKTGEICRQLDDGTMVTVIYAINDGLPNINFDNFNPDEIIKQPSVKTICWVVPADSYVVWPRQTALVKYTVVRRQYYRDIPCHPITIPSRGNGMI